MPRGDGTGPAGGGTGTGRGRMGGFGMGVGGTCICPNCGKQLAHQRGTPCQQVKCPACGNMMTRGR